MDPFESQSVSTELLDRYNWGEYRLSTIKPSVEEPELRFYIMNQEQLDEFLEDYNSYGEFFVGLELIVARGEA